jgi:hypothetical protein
MRGFQLFSITAIIGRALTGWGVISGKAGTYLMTDEERQRAMDFIVAQQAKNSVDIEKLNESHRKAEGRLDRVERILKLVIGAGSRARRDFNQRFTRVTEALTTLAEAQTRTEASIAHTDKRLDALIDIFRVNNNGRSS